MNQEPGKPAVLYRVAFFLGLFILLVNMGASAEVTRYVRYRQNGAVSYGIVDGTTVHELSGNIFAEHHRTGNSFELSAVKLLPPTAPSKILAVGRNYRSHGVFAGGKTPSLFAKLPSALIAGGDSIIYPEDAGNLHYEGEMVVVIGKKAKNVTVDEAPDYIFGITAGNDVSERDWQANDLQWLRGKATDGFAPVGPVIAQGLDYNDLLVQTRVNGEIRQSERTRNMMSSVDQIVSYASRYFTLYPGDLIFTGTPGKTRAMQPGDVVEVEVQGVGILHNQVVKP
ncbi:MAG: fumarylacetoacetate hydrolase family protein [Gammaproteobacteria bacterium]